MPSNTQSVDSKIVSSISGIPGSSEHGSILLEQPVPDTGVKESSQTASTDTTGSAHLGSAHSETTKPPEIAIDLEPSELASCENPPRSSDVDK